MTLQQTERLVKAFESIAKSMVNQEKRTEQALKELKAVANNFIEKMNSL